ncbi:hypothetical protein F4553_006545 [Allocatelliglobosispora scoriae]|uniref:Glycine zipper family protein n=1 Tax=Allocatelliglobosispora scoriae TaxID=643052 RepID=A0A841C2N4_9ACTN|nr:glycine zipper family protein [Allocatelliglobosispora scoriae]MBB5873111.1 hypothetical protein [Allocatelliglobosispora scoriae]
MLAAAASALVNAAVAALVGWLFGGYAGLMTGVVIALGFALPFAWALATAGVYPRSTRGVALFVLDHTWSLPNTAAGAAFLVGNLLAGHRLDRPRSRGSARVNVVEQAIPGYATTIGTVIAGVSPRTERHEDLHILQARLLGPLYLPLVAANYAVFALLPLWLVYHDHRGTPIRCTRDYFLLGVYPHTWHEAWAYRRDRRRP